MTDKQESGVERPRRDVSARSAVGECNYCGGNAHSLLGGEHIWKCSEIVHRKTIERLIDDLRHNSERRSSAGFDPETGDEIADELEELLGDTTSTGVEQ